jgi:flagellar FliL protein
MAEDKDEAAGGAKKKKSPILLIVIVMMVFLFGAGGFFAWKYFLLSSEDVPMKAKEANKLGPIYPLETFIVNLADKETQKYLKLTMQFELDTAKLSEELNQRKPQLRDLVIGLLTMQVYDDVASYKGKAYIRQEIMNRTNGILMTGSIKRVFFTEFVLQ